jgi:hypothetical protein
MKKMPVLVNWLSVLVSTMKNIEKPWAYQTPVRPQKRALQYYK